MPLEQIKKYTGKVRLTPPGWKQLNTAILALKAESNSNNWIAIKMGVAPNTLKELVTTEVGYQTTLINLEKIFKNLALGVPKEMWDYVPVEKKPDKQAESRAGSLPLLDSHAITLPATASPERRSPHEPQHQEIFDLPYEPDCYFAGREQELETLRKRLLEGRAAARGHKQAIIGLGGIGKTQLALKYATQFRAEYNTVFWVSAETEESIRSGYARIADLLGLAKSKTPEPEKRAAAQANPLPFLEEEPGEQKQQEQEQAIEAARNWFGANVGWLLLLDNADDTPEILPAFLPLNPKGHILITSRARQLDSLNIHAPLRLGALSEQASQKFFLQKCERANAGEDEQAAAATLAKELGYLPLAMVEAAAYIRDNDITFAHYLALYTEQEFAPANDALPDNREDLKTVLTTWELNFQAILKEARQVDTAGRHAPELLQLCAFLAPDDIPLELVVDGAAAYCGEPEAHTEQPVSGRERQVFYDDIVKPLTRYSLAAKNVEARTFNIHRKVQAVMRYKLRGETRAWQERAVCAMDSAFPFPEQEHWTTCERLKPHAVFVADAVMREDIATPAAGRLLYHLGLFFFAYGRYALAEPYAQSARALRQQIVSGVEENSAARAEVELDLAAGHYSLGLVRHHLGKFLEAENSYQQALEIRQGRLERNHPDVLEVLNALAGLYNSQRHFAEAEPRYRELLGWAREALPAEDWRLAHIEHNLGLSHYGMGNYPQAEIHFTRGLEIWENSPHNKQSLIATSYHDLANAYKKQEQFVKAEDYYNKALTIQRRVFRDGHSDVSLTCYNLSSLLVSLARYPEAAPFAEEALAIDEKLLGEDHPEIAVDLRLLAEAYRHLGRGEEAAALLRRAETI